MKTRCLKPIRQGLLLAGACVLVGASLQPVHAQPRSAPSVTRTPSYGAQAGKIADSIEAGIKGLNLTPEQKEALKAIAAKYAPQVRAIVTDKSLTREQKRSRMEALRAAARAEAEAVLTPAQKAKIQALRAAAESQIQALVARIAEEIDLTEEQKAQIQEIMTDARTQAAAIFSNTALSRMQKAQQLRSLSTTTRTAIKGVLEGSQAAQWEKISNEIRTELRKRFEKLRSSGGFGLGLL